MLKHKVYTSINLLGLSVGFAVCLLIFFLVQHESTFDRFHQNADRIARVLWIVAEVGDTEINTITSTPLSLPASFKQNFEAVESSTHFISQANLAKVEGENSRSQPFFVVGKDFMDMFSFPVLKGATNPLDEKNSIVLTESVAKRYFGDQEALGQTLLIQNGNEYTPFTIKTILKDLPANSSIQFELLMSDLMLPELIGMDGLNQWFNTFGGSFVMVKENHSFDDIRAGLPSLIKTVLEDNNEGGVYDFDFLPVTDMHLVSNDSSDNLVVTNPQLLWILSGIALLILLIACINFTTMSIGMSATRSKEVGVRKSMGAAYVQLFAQFITESFLITLCSAVLGVLLAQLALPVFNDLFDKTLIISFSIVQIAIIISLIFLISLTAGAYPAMFLALLKPIQSLKGNSGLQFGKQHLRKVLVGVQFFISLMLVACTLVMYQQLKTINNYNLGFEKDNVLIVTVPSIQTTDLIGQTKASFNKANRYRNQIIQHSQIQNAGIANATYGGNSWWQGGFPLEGRQLFYFKFTFVDQHYADILGLEFVEGRNFSADIPSDSNAFIINRSFANALKMDNPLESIIPSQRNFNDHRIVGVVKDFHHAALYDKIEPLVLCMKPELLFSGIVDLNIPGGLDPNIFVKSNTNDFNSLLSVLQEEWNSLYPDEPFDFSFFDENIQRQYENDQRLSQMVGMAAIIAIVIAAMGLFAMAALTVAGRKKEIGVRKVLGASIWNISSMINKEFLKITLLACIPALPVSYWVMMQWLSQFEIRNNPGLFVFALTLLIGVTFTVLIVSSKAISAALSNPVDSLKSE